MGKQQELDKLLKEEPEVNENEEEIVEMEKKIEEKIKLRDEVLKCEQMFRELMERNENLKSAEVKSTPKTKPDATGDNHAKNKTTKPKRKPNPSSSSSSKAADKLQQNIQ